MGLAYDEPFPIFMINLCSHRHLIATLFVESLKELIEAANNQDIEFVYAISPGLDITYSSNKDVTILRRKLDQVCI